MTTYNTENPVPSADARDRYDNSQVFDEYVNSQSNQTNDRTGASRKTWAGIENDFSQFLINSGYEFIGDYDADGPLLIERPSQIFSKDGEYWRAGPALVLPYFTLNNWVIDQPKFVSVGDAALRAQLGSSSGASYVQHKGSFLDSIFDGQGFVTGLDPTGSIDCSGLIQAALNSRRVVRIPAGDFKISNKITMNSKNVLIGCGMEATRLFRDTSIPPFDLFEIISKDDISFQDVWLDSVQKETVTDGTKRRAAIRFWDNDTGTPCNRIRINGVKFTKFTSGETQPEGRRSVVMLQKCFDVEIRGCSFDDNRSTCIMWWEGDDIRVLGNFCRGEVAPFDPFGRLGSFCTGHASASTVIGNRITGTGYTSLNVSGAGVIVSGNDIDSPKFSGITVAELTPASTGVIIANNNIRNPGIDGISVFEANGVTITGNFIRGATAVGRAGIQCYNTIEGNVPVNVHIASNNLFGNNNGVRIRGGQAITMGANIMKQNSVGMIIANASTLPIGVLSKGDTFIDNTVYAMQLEAPPSGIPQTLVIGAAEVSSSDISTIQSTGFVCQTAQSTLLLGGGNSFSPNYDTLSVETVFANRATKGFLNLLGVLGRHRSIDGVPFGGTLVYNPPSLADGAGDTATVPVSGLVVGDFVEASFSVALPGGMLLSASVTSANTVSVRFQNESGGVVDLAQGTITVVGRKF